MPSPSALDGLPAGLPALTRGEQLGLRASAVGFDWPDPVGVLAKVREEVDELAEAMADGTSSAMAEELGDLFFALCNLARHLAVEPEEVAQRANDKFERRFRALESDLDAPLASYSIEELEARWQAVKAAERGR